MTLPSLSSNVFGKEAIFSIVVAVGKPLQMDTATSNKTRPNYARIKVEVDLMKGLPKREEDWGDSR